MPSINETFGRVYIEAMSQGLPIIYSKNDGIDGFFQDGEVGYGVEGSNYDEWNIVLQKIIDNYDQISKQAIHKSKLFTWDKVSSDYLELYKQAVD
jgi:glycosyltransferase involved in cell wall biosynthesis